MLRRPDPSSRQRNLRHIEDRIARLESELRQQQDVIAKLPAAAWEAYVARARLATARHRLTFLSAEHRCLQAELRG
jgi:uncharacterized coiled-coil protein SlyX